MVAPATVPFSLKARAACRSCRRYGKKMTCPPYAEPVEYYQKLLPQYRFCAVLFDVFPVSVCGEESSLKIAEKVQEVVSSLREEGYYFIFPFGAGSCKVCKNCENPCPFPEKALTPLEGAGVDVVELMAGLGITLQFPVRDFYYRVGAVFYG